METDKQKKEGKEQVKKISSLQALWFALIVIGGVVYILEIKLRLGGFWVELSSFLVMLVGLVMGTRIWVRHNPGNPRDKDDVMM